MPLCSRCTRSRDNHQDSSTDWWNHSIDSDLNLESRIHAGTTNKKNLCGEFNVKRAMVKNKVKTLDVISSFNYQSKLNSLVNFQLWNYCGIEDEAGLFQELNILCDRHDNQENSEDLQEPIIELQLRLRPSCVFKCGKGFT